MKTLLIIASTLLFSGLSGQTKPSSDSTGTASLVTEPAGADVYVDSMFVGKSPLKGLTLTRGLHRIRAFYPSVFAWNAIVLQDSLEVSGAGQPEKRLTFGAVLRVLSDPPNGTVRYGGSELGPTPLYTRLPSMNASDLVIQKEGYDSLRVPAGEIKGGLLKVQLSPLSGSGISSRPSDVLGVNGSIPRDHMMTS
jgi:hypothetical protein